MFNKLINDGKKAFSSKEERQVKIVMGVLKVIHYLNISHEMLDSPIAILKDFIQTTISKDPEVNAAYEKIRQSNSKRN